MTWVMFQIIFCCKAELRQEWHKMTYGDQKRKMESANVHGIYYTNRNPMYVVEPVNCRNLCRREPSGTEFSR